MRNIKTVKIEKKDVQKLSNEELAELVAFGRSEPFKILKKIAEELRFRAGQTAIDNVYNDFQGAVAHGEIRGGVEGSQFIINTVKRARAELKERRKKSD